MRSLALFALLASGTVLAVPVQAEPLKIGIIESLSGSQTSTGRLFAAAVDYGVSLINAEGGFNGAPVQVIKYDNAGGTTEAADKFKQAVADGVNIIVQGASSAIAGQITEDVRKYNLRNPGKEVMYINVGAEAMELTGDKCHFYQFRYTTTAPMRVNALVKAMKAAKPDTAITGNWSNDVLLLMKAAHDAGLKVRFATAFLDQPGNIANAGEIALGDYLANSYVNGAGDPTFAEKYKAAVGHYPVFVEPQTVFAIGALQLALAQLAFHGGPINVTDIAKALENVTYMSPVGPISVRKEDHQTIRPVVVSKVVKNPKYPADGTDLGFEAVSPVAGPDAIYPVQASCQMKRPT